jgi:predicted transcriptional regulator
MTNERYAFILIAGEKYWNKLRQRSQEGKETHAFVRKSQVGPKETKKLLFYVKKPAMQIRGVADFIERLTGNREEMWTKYGAETCFESADEYNAIVQGRDKVTFVRFQNLVELEAPKPTDELVRILGSVQWFRGKYVDSDTARQLTT